MSRPITLMEALLRRAAEQPERVVYTALPDGETTGVSLTYADLDRRARAIAVLLRSRVRRGARVLLLHPPGLDFIAAVYGCFYAGVVAVPAFPPERGRGARSQPRLQAIIADSGAAALLCNRSLIDQRELATLPGLAYVPALATDGDLPSPSDWSDPSLDPAELALLQYTSGSTTRPRGVMLTHANLAVNAELQRIGYGTHADAVGVSWLPLHHDLGVIMVVVQPVFTGFPTYLMPPEIFAQRPMRWLEAISRFRGTFCGGPNLAYELCVRRSTPAERAALDLSCWECALNGAEPVRPGTIERFTEAFRPAGFQARAHYPSYGLAEANYVSGGPVAEPAVIASLDAEAFARGTVRPSSGPRARALTGLGQVLPGIRVAIVDPETGTEAPTDRIGEIWLGGPSVGTGYWGREEESREIFGARLPGGEGPFFRTGDLGFMRGGELFIAGRLKDLVIVHGRNHHPHDIELTVESVDASLRPGCGAVFSVEIEREERVVVVQEVDAKRWDDARAEAVIALVRDAVADEHDLAVHAVVLIRTGTLFKTSSGKIQRSACRSAYLEGKLDLVASWTEPAHTPPARTEVAPEPSSLGVPGDTDVNAARAWILARLTAELGLAADQLDVHAPFSRYGLDSVRAVGLSGDLSAWLGRPLPPTLLYEHPSVDSLARFVAGLVNEPARPSATGHRAGDSTLEPIAIVGIACRFPGAANADDYWKLLREGRETVGDVPASRWDADAFFDPNPDTPGRMDTRRGGFLDEVDHFDPLFFGISPREAENMDPQQRILLELTWRALEDAGQPPDALAGSRTGVFVGFYFSDYDLLQLGDYERIGPYTGVGGARTMVANRLSYLLDAHGPSFAVDTACSSSLVSLHLACNSLRSGECDLAISAGVNLILTPASSIALTKLHATSPDGHSRAFDASANGYVRAEGAGVLLLKPLSRALADGDRVYATVLGSAVNQDGRSNGVTAPNPAAQAALLREAYARAGVDPSEVQYVEAHGTGTPVGDPIEATALAEVVGRGRGADNACRIGSVKTNIGHTEGAAGIAGVIKVALAIHNRALPPSLHFVRPNPLIDFGANGLRVQTELSGWPRDEGRLLAGVSSFGIGGTNAHAVLSEPPARPAPIDSVNAARANAQLLTVSARSASALRSLAGSFAELLRRGDSAAADVCRTAARSRSHFAHRVAVVGSGSEQLAEGLDAFVRGEPSPDVQSGTRTTGDAPKVAFVFSGQGARWAPLTRSFLEREPIFCEVMARCDAFVRERCGWSVVEELTRDEASSRMSDPAITQPSLFSLQAALAALWRWWGITPDVVVGHSLGEIAAAYASGALDLEDALQLSIERGAATREAVGLGRMAAVDLSWDDAQQLVAPFAGRLCVATANSDASVVISGDIGALDEATAELDARGVRWKQISMPFASHSHQMAEPARNLVERLTDLPARTASTRIVSTVTGDFVEGPELGAAYWGRNLREPVRFDRALDRLLDAGVTVFLEVGAHPTLSEPIAHALGRRADEGFVLASLRRGRDERSALLGSLGALYAHGFSPEWTAVLGEGDARVRLPGHPWNRQRFWFNDGVASALPARAPAPRAEPAAQQAALPGRRFSPADQPRTHYWESDLSATTLPGIGDHRVEGRIVLPGAAYLEAARTAVAELWSSPAALVDVVFKSALAVPEAGVRRLQIVANEDEAGTRFEVFSRGSADRAWTLHASGRAAAGIPDGGEWLVPDVVRARCPEEVGAETHYAELARMGLEYGPVFRGIDALWRGDGEALARMRWPDAQPVIAGSARLDACFQVMAAATPRSEEEASDDAIYLPVGVGTLRVHGDPTAGVWCRARLRPSSGVELEGDLVLADEEGRALVEVVGLRVRRTSRSLFAEMHADPSDWLYETDWEEAPAQRSESSPTSWLILADERGVSDALAGELLRSGARVTIVRAADAFRSAAGSYRIRPDEPRDFIHMLDELDDAGAAPEGVVNLWPLDARWANALTGDLVEDPARSAIAGLHLVQALARAPRPARLWIATAGAQRITAGDAVALWQSTMLGFARVVAHEHPELECVSVDLDPAALSSEQASALLTEMSANAREREVAVRGEKRLVARLRALPPSPAGLAPLRLDADATYLITGGLGGLGLQVARWVVERGARHVVLLGRSAPGPEASAAVDALRREGAEVRVVSVDIAIHAQGRALLDHLRRTMPPLRGVIHAAGVIDDGALANQAAARFRRVMAPKIEGAWNLHRLTSDLPLDFFVLFSSAAGMLGNPGQANYAAANTFLDALADHRARSGETALSIAWGPWAEVGMVAREGHSDRMRAQGMAALTPAQGLQLMEELIQRRAVKAGVLPIHWSTLLARSDARSNPLFARFVARATPAASSIARVAARPSGEHAAADPSQQREALSALLHRLVRSLLRLGSDYALEVDTNLLELGMDSLTAVELKNHLEPAIGRKLPPSLVFNFPSIGEMVGHLLPEAVGDGERTASKDVAPVSADASGDRRSSAHASLEPSPIPDVELALSRGQRALWYLHQLAPESPVYNVAQAIRILTPVDPALLERAFQTVVNRHAMLRTSFDTRAGEPIQRIAASLPVHLEQEYASAWTPEELDRRLEEEIHRPFALERGPLVRLLLFRRSDGDVLLYVAHHIITDFWSQNLFHGELWGVYAALRDGTPPPPTAAGEYADHVEREDALLASPDGDLLWAYWKEQLAGEVPPLDLPAARARPPVQTFAGGLHAFRLDAQLVERMRALARAQGSTLAGVLLTAWCTLLHRYSARRDLVIGTMATGRADPSLAGVQGYFANPVPLRVSLADGPSFGTLLGRVRDVFLDAIEHQALPFPTLVERLQPARDPSRSPVFQVMFVWQQLPGHPRLGSFALLPGVRLSQGGVELESVASPHRVSQFDLNLQAAEGEDGIAARIDYNVDLFDGATVERMASHLRTLIESALAEPSAPVSALRLLPPAERRWMLEELNATEEPYPTDALLHELFEESARERPHAVAVVAAERRITYGQLDLEAAQLAEWLRARGARPNQLVGVVMEKGWEQVVAVLAVLKAGAAYLPLDAALPKERLDWLLERGEVKLALTQPWLLSELDWPETVERVAVMEGGPGDGYAFDGAESSNASAERDSEPDGAGGLVTRARPEDLAYVIFTSGSTGQPKGVMIDHRGAVNTITDVNRRFTVGADDRVLALSSLSFDLSVWDVFGVLAAGGTVVIPEASASRDPGRWAELVEREHVTLWDSVPALVDMLVSWCEDRWEADISSLRAVMMSGDWIPVKLPERIRGVVPGARVVSMGGATEASIWSIFHEIGAVDPKWKSIPYGLPMANQTFHVLDEHMEPTPVWVPGSLYIGGIGVAKGYWRDDERTAASFVTHPVTLERLYRTGDLGRRWPDGTIEFLGREDFQVKVQGYRVELGEIEAALHLHAEVKDAVVTARVDSSGGKRLIAYVIPVEGAQPTARDIREFLRAKLPEYMVPSAVVSVDSFPLSSNGKVDRGALPAPEISSDRAAPVFRAPSTTLEAQVAKVWSDVMQIDEVGLDDDFFDLGGHSLLATTLLGRIRRELGAQVPLREFLLEPTVAGLAEAASRHLGREEARLTPDPASRFEPFPLTDLQEAYWIGERDFLELGSVAAHNYIEIDAPDLDVTRLRAAMQRLVERHDALRTIVLPDGVQKVTREVPQYPIPVVDLRGLASEEQERRISLTRIEMTSRAHRSDEWPLIETRVHRLGEREHRVHVNVSLVALDAESSGILIRELAIFYHDPSAQLPAIECSFRDYVLADRMLAESSEGERARRYWEERLTQLPPPPELPIARAPRSLSGQRMKRHQARVEPHAWSVLRDRAKDAGVTINAVLLAAYTEVLATWSKTSRFSVNVLFDRRLPLHPDVGQLLGNFSCTVLLEVDASRREPFAARAAHIQEQLWADLDHSAFSGVRVIQELNRRHSEVGRAGMPVVFASTLDVRPKGWSGHTRELPFGRVVEAALQTPQVWIDHNLSEEGGALVLNWDVVEELFPADLIDEMFAAYSGLIGRLAADPEAWERPVRPLLPAPQALTFARTNATEHEFPSEVLLHELFEEQAREHPERVAVVAAGRRITYGELDHEASQLAGWLHDHGARPNSLVGVVMEKGWEQVAAVLAVLKSGAAYLPIDAGLPKERIHHLLERGDATLALTQPWLQSRLEWPEGVERVTVEPAPQPGPRRLRSEGGAVASAAPEPGGFEWGAAGSPAAASADVLVERRSYRACPRPRPDDLAYVIFTSGSTGQPKGVMIDHRGAVNTITDVNRRLAVSAEDRVLALSSLSFDLSVWDVFGVLGAGGTVVIPESTASRDPGRWAALIEREQVTLWNSVPALAEMLASWCEERWEMDVTSLRAVMMSGDWIPVKLPERIRALLPGARLISMGGATEASIWSILHEIDGVDPTWKSIPYGLPMANQTFHVLDEQMAPTPVWVPGQLYIGGIGVAKGYWRDAERTEASFVTHPATGERLYRTGDLGRRWPDGTIEFLGREDFQVKVQGYRVELGEIEAVLNLHPYVRDSVVAAVGDPRGHKRLIAFFVPEGLAPNVDALRRHLSAKLPDYMVPTAFHAIDALPLSSNGKVDRNALLHPETTAETREGAHVPPRDDIEAELCRIWADVLAVPRVGITDDFFALGGDSVLAVRLTVKIQKQLGASLPLASFLRGATVEHLAALLRRGRDAAGSSPLVLIREGSPDKQPLFLVHPIGGNVLCYHPLAQRIGFDRSVYGLQAPGLDGHEPPCTSIEEMARRYVEEVRRVQPEGPYLLGGWSMGGLVAAEMARQLQNDGQDVGLLAVMDGQAPSDGERRQSYGADEAQVLADFLHDLTGRPADTAELERVSSQDGAARAEYVLDAAKRAGIVPPEASLEHVQPLFEVFRANHRAMREYRAPLFVGRVTLFRAGGREASTEGLGFVDHTLGWNALSTEPVEMHNAPGDHYTLLSPPNVYFVAERLQHCLHAASGRVRRPTPEA